MLGLLSRSRRKPPPAKVRSFRPALEMLESRDCPSTLSMSAAVLPSTKMVTIQGQVTNTSSPGGLTVQLSGVVSGTAVTDASGDFSVQLAATGLGTVSGATTDGQSNTAQVTLSDPAAVVTQMTDTVGSLDVYTFTGHVTGGYQGETVNFGGLHDLEGKSTTLDANGNFSITVQLDGFSDDNGDATAQAVDAWGTQSNLYALWVQQTITYPGGTGGTGGQGTP